MLYYMMHMMKTRVGRLVLEKGFSTRRIVEDETIKLLDRCHGS